MKLLLTLLLMFPISCGTAPPREAVVAADLLQRAIEANAQTRSIILEAFSSDLRSMYAAQLRLISEREFGRLNLDDDAAGRAAKFKLLQDALAEKQRIFDSQIAAKVKQFSEDPNQETARRLAASLKRLLGTIDKAARAIEGLIEEGQALFGKGTSDAN